MTREMYCKIKKIQLREKELDNMISNYNYLLALMNGYHRGTMLTVILPTNNAYSDDEKCKVDANAFEEFLTIKRNECKTELDKLDAEIEAL